MKKLTISLLAVIFSVGSVFAQPVSDMAIIPIGVTLNSILRLNVTSGGSLEYVVNTMDQYINGIPNSTTYQTSFTVASSVDFNVVMSTDAASFTGVDIATSVAPVATPNTMNLDRLAYAISQTGVGGVFVFDAAGYTVLETTQTIIDGTGGSAGDINQNAFRIDWELGTTNAAGNLLGIPSDRYVVNVYLELIGL